MAKPVDPSDVPAPLSTRGRLNGWKEIAAYLNKGVRTVQRWEKELGLPVRRMGTGRAEIVFAVAAEIDAWRRGAEKAADYQVRPGEEDDTGPREVSPHPASDAADPQPVGDAPSPDHARPPRLLRFLVIAIAIVAVAAVALGVAAWWKAAGGGEPFEVRVERGGLRVYDESSTLLWEHRFELPLRETPEARADRRAGGAVIVDDLDGDGHREVLFATGAESMDFPHGLYCFDRRGVVRFRHRPQRGVTFGGIPCPGPWLPTLVTVTDEGGGRKAVWVVSVDRDQFPSVLEKVDANGTLLGEFWHPGIITCVKPATFGGRPVMLLGASNNEFRGAALAVVDRASPTGTAPAVLPKFTCRGCPAGKPTAYLVLPGGRVEEVQDNNTGVADIVHNDQGVLTVVVRHSLGFSRVGRGQGDMLGHTSYILSPELHPVSAQHQPDYRVLHNEAFRRGLFDHAFGEADDAALFPLRRWNETGFDLVWPSS
jgi:hypothetical protein